MTRGSPTMSEKKADDDEVVITPAGPLPRKDVHHVRPGEKVRINERGEAEIVRDDCEEPKEEPKP